MRHATGRTASWHARPRAHVGAASGGCPKPEARGRTALPPVPEPGGGVPRLPAADGTVPSSREPLASSSADASGPDAESDFLQALRSRRPSYRLDEASFSDPLTAAISRFTGTA
ncbi:hypothetical protein OHB54_31015 [Streptomyces sp. NBC_01007]|nr:hypothetical protein OHB54_31015 [Streptomyces sp. NBC_01007]